MAQSEDAGPLAPSAVGEDPGSPDLDVIAEWSFVTGGTSDEIVGAGWSKSESLYRWCVGVESELLIPLSRCHGASSMELTVHPFIAGDTLPWQRLEIDFAGHMLPSEYLNARGNVRFDLPPFVQDGTDETLRIRLIHPDGRAPSDIMPNHHDSRCLSIALSNLRLLGKTVEESPEEAPMEFEESVGEVPMELPEPEFSPESMRSPEPTFPEVREQTAAPRKPRGFFGRLMRK